MMLRDQHKYQCSRRAGSDIKYSTQLVRIMAHCMSEKSIPFQVVAEGRGPTVIYMAATEANTIDFSADFKSSMFSYLVIFCIFRVVFLFFNHLFFIKIT